MYRDEPDLDKTREDFLGAFARLGIKPTPQAIAALLESVLRVSPEVLGDTDALLVGLLYSGSYTVDVLEAAGLNARSLRALALSTAASWDGVYVPPVEALFGSTSVFSSLLERLAGSEQVLETGHLLQAALEPELQTRFASLDFPLGLRTDIPKDGIFTSKLESGVCELIAYATTIIEADNAPIALRYRHHPLTDDEDGRLDRELGVEHKGMMLEEFEFILNALNQWYVHRRILTEPTNACVCAVTRCGGGLLYGPGQFAELGGDFKAVELGLRTAARVSPERDLGGFVLFERSGRIHIGQYTYRNAFYVREDFERSPWSSHVHLQALRPVSLLSREAIERFENLLSRDDTRELEIQAFLAVHPEFLHALGYIGARPHIALTFDDRDERRKLVPDFILELPAQRGFDVLELKLPTASLLARDPYLRASADLLRALAQLRFYRRAFDNASVRKEFLSKYGLAPFRPELVVVMGRSSAFRSADERREVEEQIPGVRLVTYDDLVAYGRSRMIDVSTFRGHP